MLVPARLLPTLVEFLQLYHCQLCTYSMLNICFCRLQLGMSGDSSTQQASSGVGNPLGVGEGGFSLAGTDEGFGVRSRDVFASLSTIEAKHCAVEQAKTDLCRREDARVLKTDPRPQPIAVSPPTSLVPPPIPHPLLHPLSYP